MCTFQQAIKQFIWRGLKSVLLYNNSSLSQKVRKRIYNTSCYIDTGVIISNDSNFCCGDGCALYHGTYLLNTKGTISLGNHSHLGAMCYVNACHGMLQIGDDVAIGPNTSIIVYSNHYDKSKKVTETYKCEDIIIGNNVFIGANCVLLPGTIIEDNVIIGAGSIVKGNIPSNTINAGVPVRKISKGWYK